MAEEFCTESFQFLTSGGLVLHNLVTEQIGQVLRVSLAVHRYAMKNGPIRELFYHLLRKCNFTVTLRIGPLVLQLLLDNSQANVHIPFEMGDYSV